MKNKYIFSGTNYHFNDNVYLTPKTNTQERSMTEELQTTDMPDTDIPSKDERLWGMLSHLLSFSGYLIPFGSVLGPLIVWMIKKDEMPFVNDQGKESLNFQLTMLIAVIVSAILCLVLIGFLMLGVVLIFQIVVVIIASIKANDGIKYRYPYTIRFIK